MKKTLTACALVAAMTAGAAQAEGPQAEMTKGQIASEIISTKAHEGSGSAPGIIIPLLLLAVIAASMSSGSL